MRSKLARNLKPGDRYIVHTWIDGRLQTETVTVQSVTRKRHWFSRALAYVVAVSGPFWYSGFTADAQERIDIL